MFPLLVFSFLPLQGWQSGPPMGVHLMAGGGALSLGLALVAMMVARRFTEMSKRIEMMGIELRELDTLKTDFLSTVSHELRTPLTSIGGYVKLLADGDAGPTTETQKEFLKIVDTNVTRLTRLINEILDVEALQAGQLQLVKESQDLVPILKECCDTFKMVAKQKKLDFIATFPSELGPILGDRTRLVQLFLNLISNAIKYTQEGFVQIEAEQNDLAVAVRICDSGVGLSQEEQEQLFQKFYRARSGLSASEGGTGLGLLIVRGLVEAHGGKIAIESAAGQGTQFTVTLPLIQTGVEELPDVPKTLPPVGRTRKIWIVDTHVLEREKMLGLLKRFEATFGGEYFDIRMFKSVQEIPKVNSSRDAPHLLILDPHSSFEGVGATSNARKKIHKFVPILVVSQLIDTGMAFAEGASAILTKPIGEAEFFLAIRDLMTFKGWRILIADHNTDFRILLKRGFEQQGTHVDDVDHGNLVLGRLEKEHYDLVLIAFTLPDVSGLELLKIIRKNPRYDALSIFVMTEGDEKLSNQLEFRPGKRSRMTGKYQGIKGIVDSALKYLEKGT
jgi:signal transduction histidine kinase/DNA-binding response OmpR family regulator